MKRQGPFASPEAQIVINRLLATVQARDEQIAALREALLAARMFERVYQESLGATPTAAQWERLDSLQSRFIDLLSVALSNGGFGE